MVTGCKSATVSGLLVGLFATAVIALGSGSAAGADGPDDTHWASVAGSAAAQPAPVAGSEQTPDDTHW